MKEFYEVTPSEKQIVEELRTLKPYEQILICADKNGAPDVYFTTRTVKAIISVGTVSFVK